jgi:type II secretory pathway pseudopilin PulG
LPRCSGNGGWTLFELILVFILLAILAASAAPGFLGTAGFSLEGAAAMIKADIRHAQELAMATHDAKDVVFVTGDTSYTVEGKDDGVTRTVELPAGVSIGTTVTFTFNPLGEPTAGGGGSVTINAGGGTKTVNVEAYTGTVSIS